MYTSTLITEESTFDVVANVPDYNIVNSKFEPQFCSYIYFRIKTLIKVM